MGRTVEATTIPGDSDPLSELRTDAPLFLAKAGGGDTCVCISRPCVVGCYDDCLSNCQRASNDSHGCA